MVSACQQFSFSGALEKSERNRRVLKRPESKERGVFAEMEVGSISIKNRMQKVREMPET